MNVNTLVDMLKRNTERDPQKTALVYMDSKMSYQDLYDQSAALANFLVDSGLKKGDRVGLMLDKTPEAIVSFLGIMAAGGVVFPIDCNQTQTHLQYLLDLTLPGALIVSESHQKLLSTLTISFPKERVIIIGSPKDQEYAVWRNMVADAPKKLPEIELNVHDTGYLNLTSGTTGVPKCAVTTHDNIYWNTRAAVESLNLDHTDVHLCMFPVFSHPHELLARPMFLGGTIVLIDKISPKHIASTISENGVTCMMAIASIYETLVRLHETSPFQIPSLRLPESGGMHVNPTLSRQFRACFGVPMVPVWGSTEAAGIAFITPKDGYRPGSMGKVCPYYEAKIVDDQGNELPAGEIGELIIKGPAVCAEYYRSGEETQKHMRDGWFFTGDMVKRDADGFFYFAGRRTGMMKVAGLKVYPIEIEEVLSTHPKIDQVAVVKAQDGLHGEVPRAVIIPKPGEALDKREIRTFCEQKLSRYKVPRVIEFRTEFPKTSGGKIIWREL